MPFALGVTWAVSHTKNGEKMENGSILLAPQMRHILASLDSVASAADDYRSMRDDYRSMRSNSTPSRISVPSWTDLSHRGEIDRVPDG